VSNPTSSDSTSGKPSNKARDRKRATERVERRRLAKGNSSRRNRGQTQGWITLPHELDRVRQAAQRRSHPYPLERLCVNTRSRSPVH
jgi:hypothetical protein